MSGIYIRIDVDKPFGSKNIFRRLFSKSRENFYFPLIEGIYLKGFVKILNLLNEYNFSGHFYFRNCTIPLKKHIILLENYKHIIGFHAENTSTFENFKEELNYFQKKLKNYSVESFTKHGSGYYKLGKNHYAKYEPDKYFNWAKKLNKRFDFGNGIINLNNKNDNIPYFRSAFWIEKSYRDQGFNQMDQLIEFAKTNDVVVLIHPCNFERYSLVKEDFNYLLEKMVENKIICKTIYD